MGGEGTDRGVAPAREGQSLVHPVGIRVEQRIHLAALLILLLFPSIGRAGDISFDPAITEEQFHFFSSRVAEGIYATPVEPASPRGILAFDVGVVVTAVPVDDEADYWLRSVSSDFSTGGYIAIPRLVVSKGVGFANLSASYARIYDSGATAWGGAVDLPIIRGGIAKPSLSLRGAWASLKGVDDLDLKTYGAEIFLGKGIGPVTPYAAAGMMRVDSEASIRDSAGTVVVTLRDDYDHTRLTLGVRLSLLVARIVVEATQAEERTYSARFSFGL